ncbi:hypothetical protein [Variovorax boronicumulans]
MLDLSAAAKADRTMTAPLTRPVFAIDTKYYSLDTKEEEQKNMPQDLSNEIVIEIDDEIEHLIRVRLFWGCRGAKAMR